MVKYSFDLLKAFCEAEGCVVDLLKYKDISSRESKITFQCKNQDCLQECSKTFRMLYRLGAYCNDCTIKVKSARTRDTCLVKYGVNNVSKAECVKAKMQQTNITKYGATCSLHNPDVRAKTIETCISRYGCTNPFSNQEIKNKIRDKNRCKLGCDYPMQSTDVKEKSKKTNLEKYGVEYGLQNIEIQLKAKETVRTKYGVNNVSQSHAIQAKKVATNIERFGFPHPTQNPEMFSQIKRAAFSKKQFTFPTGDTRDVQGYEPYALNLLLSQGYTSDEIVTDPLQVPEIWYCKPHSVKESRYYCDIFLPRQNLIIEVKSTYTFEKDKDVNLLKAKTCKEQGYAFEFWVFNDKGELLEYNIEDEAMSMTANDVLFDMLVNVHDSSEERVFLTWYLGFLFKEFLVEYDSCNLCQVISEFATYRQSPEGRRNLKECIMLLNHNDTPTYNDIFEVVSTIVD
jgi:hypothetical protein